MMMAEKIRHVLLRITGFVTGMIVTIVSVYLFGAIALLIIITSGCIILVINRKHKRLTNEIEHLKKEINKLEKKK